MFRDSHHILHNRQEWELRAEGKALRRTKSLIPTLTRAEHEEIHANVPAVPLLGYHALRRTLQLFEPTNNTLESVDSLIRSIDESGRNPKAHYVERGVSELAIWALELQLPFLIEAEASERRLIVDMGE